MQLGKDIFNFIKTLTLVDYIFFFAVIMLLILIITLIYFIKLNKESLSINDENDSSDLLEITQELEKIEEKPRIEFTEYEKDQEEKAIISYDELVKKGRGASISYDDEKDLDGLSIKKVNIDNISNVEEPDTSVESSYRVISYKQEEEFLTALKQLNSILN